MGAGAEGFEHRPHCRDVRRAAPGHDGERAGLRRGRAGRDRGVDPAHAAFGCQPGGELSGRRHVRRRVVDQELAGRRALGEAVRAEHGGEIVLGHHPDVDDVARARRLGRTSGGANAMRLGAHRLVRDDDVARDPIPARDQPSGERVAHQTEADATEVRSAVCHGSPSLLRACAHRSGSPRSYGFAAAPPRHAATISPAGPRRSGRRSCPETPAVHGPDDLARRFLPDGDCRRRAATGVALTVRQALAQRRHRPGLIASRRTCARSCPARRTTCAIPAFAAAADRCPSAAHAYGLNRWRRLVPGIALPMSAVPAGAQIGRRGPQAERARGRACRRWTGATLALKRAADRP